MRIDTTQIFLLNLKIRLNDVIGRTVAPVEIFGKKREEGQTRHSDHSYSKKKLNVFYLAKTTMLSYKVSDSRSGGATTTTSTSSACAVRRQWYAGTQGGMLRTQAVVCLVRRQWYAVVHSGSGGTQRK